MRARIRRSARMRSMPFAAGRVQSWRATGASALVTPAIESGIGSPRQQPGHSLAGVRIQRAPRESRDERQQRKRKDKLETFLVKVEKKVAKGKSLRRTKRRAEKAGEILSLHQNKAKAFAQISPRALGELNFLDTGVAPAKGSKPRPPAIEDLERESPPEEKTSVAEEDAEEAAEEAAPLPDFSPVCPDGGEPVWDRPTVTVNLVGVLPKEAKGEFETQVTTDLEQAKKIYLQAGIEIKKGRVEFVEASRPERMQTLAESELGDNESELCGSDFVKQVFADMKKKKVSRSRSLKSPLIFYVPDIGDARGWACDADNYAGIMLKADANVLAHEIGHILLKTDIHAFSDTDTIFGEGALGTRMTLYDHIQPLRTELEAGTIFPGCR